MIFVQRREHRFIGLYLLVFFLSMENNAFAHHDFSGLDEEIGDDIYQYADVRDPYENINRKIFAFNRGFDKIILRPISHGYRSSVPKWGRDRVDNILSNLISPVYMVNFLLQGETDRALNTGFRFMINSSLGLGGFMDIAAEGGLKEKSTGFAETLSYYCVDAGVYHVLPFFGPSTTRDTVGRLVDMVTDPWFYVLNPEARWVREGVNVVHMRAKLIPVTNQLENLSFDLYATYRSTYIQSRGILKYPGRKHCYEEAKRR